MDAASPVLVAMFEQQFNFRELYSFSCQCSGHMISVHDFMLHDRHNQRRRSASLSATTHHAEMIQNATLGSANPWQSIYTRKTEMTTWAFRKASNQSLHEHPLVVTSWRMHLDVRWRLFISRVMLPGVTEYIGRKLGFKPPGSP